MTEKQVADEIAQMCFRKAIEKEKEAHELEEFDCKEISTFTLGEAFAYNQMIKWIQGFLLNLCKTDGVRKEE